jgi:hypothetical protein
MEPTKNTTKTSEEGTMETTQQSQLILDPNSSCVVSFLHTTESLTVYSFQNLSTCTPPILQRIYVPRR